MYIKKLDEMQGNYKALKQGYIIPIATDCNNYNYNFSLPVLFANYIYIKKNYKYTRLLNDDNFIYIRTKRLDDNIYINLQDWAIEQLDNYPLFNDDIYINVIEEIKQELVTNTIDDIERYLNNNNLTTSLDLTDLANKLLDLAYSNNGLEFYYTDKEIKKILEGDLNYD